MLHNVFQFDDRPVERIMIPRREVDHLDLRASADDTSACSSRPRTRGSRCSTAAGSTCSASCW